MKTFILITLLSVLIFSCGKNPMEATRMPAHCLLYSDFDEFVDNVRDVDYLSKWMYECTSYKSGVSKDYGNSLTYRAKHYFDNRGGVCSYSASLFVYVANKLGYRSGLIYIQEMPKTKPPHMVGFAVNGNYVTISENQNVYINLLSKDEFIEKYTSNDNYNYRFWDVEDNEFNSLKDYIE